MSRMYAVDILNDYAPNFRRSLKDWLIYTPDDFESCVYLTGGNIHHSDRWAISDLWQLSFQERWSPDAD